jgi:ribosomal protein S18 acetylase RimI-like enzyme
MLRPSSGLRPGTEAAAGSGAPPAARGLEVGPCSAELRPEALAMLYRRAPAAVRSQLIRDALADADRGAFDLRGLWVARRRGGVVAVMLSQALAGRAVAVWAPETDLVFGRDAAARELVRGLLGDLCARGFRLAQALLDDSAPSRGGSDLTAGGMRHVTDLIYLECDTRRERRREHESPWKPTPPPLDWRSFGPDSEDDFRAALEATYDGSLDMPELDGLRSLDDVLAGHRAGGRFVADRWRLGRVRGEPNAAAVVLLSASLDRDMWEVAYLGLTPPARGRGLGRAALEYALALAEPHVPRIELAVDLRNGPARRLYDRAGFRPFERRAVYIAELH